MNDKIKQAVAALLIAVVAGGTGHLVTKPGAKPRADKLTCPTSIHLADCAECQVLTTNVVIGTIESAKKQASVAPVTSS